MSTTVSSPGAAAGTRAHQLLGALRATFRSGRTRPLAWRRAQLEGLLALLADHEGELLGALRDDLRKPAIEGYGADIGSTAVEIRHLLKHVGSWMKPKRVIPGITGQPGRAHVVAEPLGVGLIIA